MLSFPQVRQCERRRPFAVALAVAAFGLSVRFDLLDPPVMRLRDFRPHEIFWIFALGWLAARATTTARRALVTVMVLASVPGFFASGEREVLVTGSLLLIVWVRSVAVPRPLTKVAGLLAAGSLGIYLTHWQVFPPLMRLHGPLLATVGSVVVGLVVWTLASRITAAVPAQLRSVPPDPVLQNPSQTASRSEALRR